MVRTGDDAGRQRPVVYINLDRATQRRAFMEAQAERLGFSLERLPAFAAQDVADADFSALSIQWERRLTRIEVAVFLSHRRLWERAAASTTGLVVLEDDAVLSHRFASILSLPMRTFDLVNLEYFARRKFFRDGGKAEEGSIELSPVLRDKAGAAAYYVSPEGASRLLSRAWTHAAPADAFLFAQGRLSLAQLEPTVAVQAEVLQRAGVTPDLVTPTQIHVARKDDRGDPLRVRFALRRAATQARLLPLHLRRLTDLRFREPVFHPADFVADPSRAKSSQ